MAHIAYAVRVQEGLPEAATAVIVQPFVALGKLALLLTGTVDVNPPQIALFPLGQAAT